MNPAAKVLLFLLALPILIGAVIVILPLLVFLLVLSLFIPSVRIFHLYRPPREDGTHPGESSSGFQDGEVLDAEYTVVESSETDDNNNSGSGRPPELKS